MGARQTEAEPAMVEPEEIPDAEHELVIERAAAIDVAKAAGKVCVRLPGKSGRRFSRVWDVAARSGAITELAEHLVELGVEKVTVESTSDYWRIWYYLLEAAGLDVQLVNARDVKNVPGRPKTDKLDAVWLAKLTEKGLLRPCFVPPAPIRELRDYTRLRDDLTRERTRYWQRLEKLLEDALIKVSAVASTLDTLSARDMIEALIAGERDPRRLADLARGRMKTKRSALIKRSTAASTTTTPNWPGCCSTRSTRCPRKSAPSPPASSSCSTPWPTPTPPGERGDPRRRPAPTRCRSRPRRRTTPRRRGQPPPRGRAQRLTRSNVSTRSPASARAPRRSSSPRSAWT